MAIKNVQEIYSALNEGKSVVAERFIRTLKNKIYKCMTSKSRNAYIDKLDDIVNKYNNIYYRIIKMKLFNVKPSIRIDLGKENNNEGPKFKVFDHVQISKYKNIFVKYYVPNWSGENFVVKNVKNNVPWTYFLSDRNSEKVVGTFYEKELQRKI